MEPDSLLYKDLPHSCYFLLMMCVLFYMWPNSMEMKLFIIFPAMLKAVYHAEVLRIIIIYVICIHVQRSMLRCIHSVITSSMSVPTHSVSFPLDRSDKDNVAVMVSTIHKFGNSPISAVIWLYLDGCISSAYNSASKGIIMYCHVLS